MAQTLVLGMWFFLSGVVSGQVGDIVARRGLNLKGRIEADVQLLSESGEITIAETAVVRGQALAPEDRAHSGMNPGEIRRIAATVRIDAPATGAVLKGQLRAAPSFEFPALAGPKPSRGQQAVTIDGSEKPGRKFENAADVTIRYTFESVALPPGSYGKLLVEGARVVLGEAGGLRPARYDFASIDLLEQSRLELAGPVIITTGRLGRVEGVIGRPDLPAWLDFRIAGGQVALGARSAVYGSLFAPNSAVTLASGAAVEGWLAGDAVTVERNGRFKAIRPDWNPKARAEVVPAFSQKAVRIQNRLAGLSARVAGQFSVAIAYDDDVPTLTLAELPQRKGEKTEAEERAVFFEAFRVLLAVSTVENARVVMPWAAGNRKHAAETLDVRMTKADFESHLWALGREEIPAESVRKIQASPGLQNLFMLRSLKVAKAEVDDAR